MTKVKGSSPPANNHLTEKTRLDFSAGASQGSFFSVYSLSISSALDHSATAPSSVTVSIIVRE